MIFIRYTNYKSRLIMSQERQRSGMGPVNEWKLKDQTRLERREKRCR